MIIRVGYIGIWMNQILGAAAPPPTVGIYDAAVNLIQDAQGNLIVDAQGN